MIKEIVIIHWKDACKHGNDTQHIKDCRDFNLMELISTGILLNETNELITVGNDYCPEYKNCRDVNTYPKSGISKIKRVKINRKWL